MISVVLCTYNRAASVKKTLMSFSQLSVPADLTWELILVDNNSKDETREVAEEARKIWNLPIRYVFEPKQGISFARNAGVQAAHGEIIAFTDDDVFVDPDWLWRLAEVFKTRECTGLGGKILPIWNCEKPDWYQNSGPYRLHAAIVHFDLGDQPGEMKTTPFTANMAIKKVAFEKYGYFRTDIGLKGETRMPGHETEFCQRVVQGGGNFYYEPRAIIHHPVEPERARKEYFKQWYFGFGRTEMRVRGYPPGAILYGGIPRYMLRILAEKLLKWIFTLDASLRFYYKLQTFQTAGSIYEARQLHKQGINGAKSPETSGQ